MLRRYSLAHTLSRKLNFTVKAIPHVISVFSLRAKVKSFYLRTGKAAIDFLELSPYLEILARNLYWRFPYLRKSIARARLRKPNTSSGHTSFDRFEFISAVRDLGVNEDDCVLVHSSMVNFKKLGISSKDVAQIFLGDILPSGTLVCPTFPCYPSKNKRVKRKDGSKPELVYDVARSRSWTGELGAVLNRIPGSRRSLHPLNTLTANGVHTPKIFENESPAGLDLPCGIRSSWAALAEINAKILFIDVDIAHNITMIHVAEDCHESNWPKFWYQKKTFTVINGQDSFKATVRERTSKSSYCYAERTLERDLRKLGLVRTQRVGPIMLSILQTSELLDFLLSAERPRFYPYYLTWLASE